VACALPALDLRLGNPDESNLPTTRTERRAYDLVAQGFGPGINGPLVIVTDASSAHSVRAEVAADPGIASVAPPAPHGAVATLLAYPTTAPQDVATVETIQRLRATVDAHVGGNTADWADIGDRLEQRLPYFLAAVVLLSFLLLTIVFRSILVPLKAAVLNLLGVGAAYGVLVVVFQWGWAADLIGLEATLPIIPFIPVFMFAVLFGLSMDYEVFLLSRIRESYLRTGDNRASVIGGIAGTARVITAAALIMIAVFGGFVFDDDPRVKMFGLGLATAILIDATLIRLVLVPAIMHLLGDANWWLPRWLGRVLPARPATALEG
jgi:RND superfamily putative drug exporter